MLLDTLHRWENRGIGTCPVIQKATQSLAWNKNFFPSFPLGGETRKIAWKKLVLQQRLRSDTFRASEHLVSPQRMRNITGTLQRRGFFSSFSELISRPDPADLTQPSPHTADLGRLHEIHCELCYFYRVGVEGDQRFIRKLLIQKHTVKRGGRDVMCIFYCFARKIHGLVSKELL